MGLRTKYGGIYRFLTVNGRAKVLAAINHVSFCLFGKFNPIVEDLYLETLIRQSFQRLNFY